MINYNLDEEFRITQEVKIATHAVHSGQGELFKERVSPGDTILEIGVNWGATTRAFMAGRPAKMIGIDIEDFGHITQRIKDLAEHNGIEYEYYVCNSLTFSPIPDVDIALFDGDHSLEMVKAEFKLYAPHVKRYIFLHDINHEGKKSPAGGAYQVYKASMEFLEDNDEWEIDVEDRRLAGLLILKRVKG